MKFSVTIALLLAISSAASAQESKQAEECYQLIEDSSKQIDELFPEATRALVHGLVTDIDLKSEAENRIYEGLSNAERISAEQPQAAKEIAERAIEDFKQLIALSGLKVFQGHGSALALSNAAAKPGMAEACQLIQYGVLDSLNAMEVAQKYIEQGSSFGGNATKLSYKAAMKTAQTSVAILYEETKKSVRAAVSALKKAYYQPISGSASVSINDGSIQNDPNAQMAINQINREAENALRRGANASLVNELRKEIIQSISDFAKIGADAIAAIESIYKLARVNPTSARVLYFKKAEEFKARATKTIAEASVTLQAVGVKSGNPSSESKLSEAFKGIFQTTVNYDYTQVIGGDLLYLGVSHESNILRLAYETMKESEIVGPRTFYQVIVKCVKVGFSLL